MGSFPYVLTCPTLFSFFSLSKNYGDESDAYGLMYPSLYSNHGVYEADFFEPRTPEEVRTYVHVTLYVGIYVPYMHYSLYCTYTYIRTSGLCDNRNNIITIFYDIFTKLSRYLIIMR